jgi:hypothetical protein
MRNTDPVDPVPFQPLGEKVVKAAPTPAPQVPQGPSGLVTVDGKLQTTSHRPYVGSLTLEEAIANWRVHYAEDHDLDFLP